MRAHSNTATAHVGQLLIVGFEGTKMTPRLAALLKRIQPAGVILFARNIKESVETWQLLRDCQECATAPLFKCIDLEGGTVDRLRDVLGPAPSAAEVFATADRRLFCRHGQIIGENCRALGFNLDFAPVLDLAFEASRSVLGSRAVSADPRQVTRYAREFLAGLKRANILGCGKHFPGLGEGTLDSHHQLPAIEKPLKNLWAADLVPYRGLRARLPMIMVSHAAYPAVTKNRTPASLSGVWITDILRKKIGYRNLIVSDDLEMGGVLSAAPVERAALEFIRAGGDLCLVCHREDRALATYDALAAAIKSDPAFSERACQSMRKIASFKKKATRILRAVNQPSPAKVEKLSRSLWEFGEQVRLEALARAGKKRQSRSVEA
jgi:beta-N-acetylhexosaminidase